MAATNGTMLGIYQGVSLAAAFANPSSLDLLQIIDTTGAGIVVRVSSTGAVTLNPAASACTNGTILGVFGTTVTSGSLATYFANAFDNPSNLDIFQVYSEVAQPVSAGSGGMVLIARLSYLGVYSTS